MTGSPASPRFPPADADEPVTRTVGSYRLIELLGEGGMGTVWLAEQTEPVHRNVALKLVRSDLDGAEVLARFETELSVLALMNHPNIAHVYDAGRMPDGSPYIAMEYVQGLSVTQFCDQRELDVDARLRLFAAICRGVHHAHQKGILHRDLKPSNVLVELVDGRPVPKIIDFGVAKAMQPIAGARALGERGRFIGTPAYMSPEQASISALGVDSRTDVYSLGVLLYELLVGEVPFESGPLSAENLAELPQRIKDRTPSRPSTRCRRPDETALKRALARQATPRRLARRLRGDLDAIVVRALQKDPEKRFASASEMAQDVERHLEHLPLSAGPRTPGYHARKFLARHRVPAVAGAIVALSLIGGLTVAVVQFRRARENADRAFQLQVQAEDSAARARDLLARAQAAESESRAALERERAALTQSTGRRLAAQALSLTRESPTLALLLAIEGAVRAPGAETTAALYAALENHRVIAQWDGHDATTRALALSGDGSLLVSGDDTGLVLLRDARSGAIRWRADAHAGAVSSAGFALDDRSVWSASLDGRACVYDAASGRVQHDFAHPAAIGRAVVASRGSVLFTSCSDGRVRAFDLAGGGAPQVVAEHDGGIQSMSTSDDGRWVASTGRSQIVLVSDRTAAGTPPLRIELTRGEPPPYYDVDANFPTSVDTSPDGSTLLTRARDGQVAVWDTATGRELRRLTSAAEFCGAARLAGDGRTALLQWRDWQQEPRAAIVDAIDGTTVAVLVGASVSEKTWSRFSPDGRTLVTRASEWFDVWDVATGRHRGRLSGPPHGMYSPQFRPGGEEVLLGGHDGLTRVFRVGGLREEWALAGLQARGEIDVETFAPDGEQAVASRGRDDAQSFELLDVRSGRRLLELRPPQPGSVQVAFDPTGAHVALAGESGLRVWDLVSRRLVCEHEGPHARPRFSSGGEWLAVAVADGITAIEVAHGRVAATIATPGPKPQSSELSRDGRTLVTAGGASGSVSLWSVPDGALLERYRHSAFVFAAAFDPAGERVLSFANDTTAQIYDLKARAVVRSLDRLPTTEHAGIAWSPDGRRCVIACDRDVLLFDADSAALKMRWKSDDLQFEQHLVHFTPDGRWLLVRRHGGVARFLPLDPLEHARSLAPRRLSAAEMATFDVGDPEERVARRHEEEAAVTSALRAVRLAQVALVEGECDEALALLQKATTFRQRMPSAYWLTRARALAARSQKHADSPTGHERRSLDIAAALDALAAGLDDKTIDRAALTRPSELEPLRTHPEFAALLTRAGD